MHCLIPQNEPNFFVDFSRDRAVLAISNGGGGGHKMTVEAMHKFYNLQNKSEYSFKILDVIQDSFPKKCGKIIHNKINNMWNQAKKNGDIQKQEHLVKGKPFKKGPCNQRFADLIFFLPVFFATLIRLLKDKNITRIIDAQPLSTNALVKAVRVVNKLFHRRVRVTKIMTDFPTSDAMHFANPIKNLNKNDKKIFELISVPPLIENGMSEEKWWLEFFGLELNKANPEKSQVKYCEFPLRKSFFDWKDKDVSQNHPTVQFKINNEEELKLINRSLKKKLEVTPQKDSENNAKRVVNIAVKDSDFIQIVTIGSQAANKTKDYIKDFVEVSRKKMEKDDSKVNYYFFAACGKHEVGKNDLFSQVAVLSENIPSELKNRVHIVPLGYQDGEEFAAMIHRANVGIYGAGGLTTMEVLTVAKGLVLFHSEISDPTSSILKSPQDLQSHLLQGFAVWEKGNVRYAMNKNKNAKLVLPGKIYKNILLQNLS